MRLFSLDLLADRLLRLVNLRSFTGRTPSSGAAQSLKQQLQRLEQQLPGAPLPRGGDPNTYTVRVASATASDAETTEASEGGTTPYRKADGSASACGRDGMVPLFRDRACSATVLVVPDRSGLGLAPGLAVHRGPCHGPSHGPARARELQRHCIFRRVWTLGLLRNCKAGSMVVTRRKVEPYWN